MMVNMDKWPAAAEVLSAHNAAQDQGSSRQFRRLLDERAEDALEYSLRDLDFPFAEAVRLSSGD